MVQRQIKFRAWDKNIPRNTSNTELNNPSGEMVEWEYIKKSSYLKSLFDGEYPCMQFTGLTDCKATEIYEGDIVSFPLNMGEEFIAEVKWKKENACFYISNGNRYREFSSLAQSGDETGVRMDNIEIIGNIYQNPGLL